MCSGEEEVIRWREEDQEQQHLDNAMFLWTRYLQHLRTEVVSPPPPPPRPHQHQHHYQP